MTLIQGSAVAAGHLLPRNSEDQRWLGLVKIGCRHQEEDSCSCFGIEVEGLKVVGANLL